MSSLTFPRSGFAANYDIVCFSHLRWDFVYQRPQHLLSRFAKRHEVLFIEEAIFDGGPARFEITERDDGLAVAVPHLPENTDAKSAEKMLKRMVADLLGNRGIENYVAWYYTPMMLGWSEHLAPHAVVYDCMDELSAFKN